MSVALSGRSLSQRIGLARMRKTTLFEAFQINLKLRENDY